VCVDHERPGRLANFFAGSPCEAGRVAQILKFLHVFLSRSTLTRESGKHSCTHGQNWNRTSTTCPKNISRLYSVVAADGAASRLSPFKGRIDAALRNSSFAYLFGVRD
jgi:hypothetical protein